MANRFSLRRIQKEYIEIQKDANGPKTITNLIIKPNPENLFEWYFVAHSLNDTPYDGGFYCGKLMLPPEYPSKPPSILMLTPSGRFEVEKRICFSMSDYHPETWSPAWTISKVLIGVVSFMVTDERTTGCVLTSDAAKRAYAKASLGYNTKHIPMFNKLFNLDELNVTEEEVTESNTA